METETKRKILNLLSHISREGIEGLISYLEDTARSDFFQAPCSTEHHLCVLGGLAEHSLNVYNLLKEKVNRYNLETKEESIILTGLCHDLCKINFYAHGTRNVKENGVWKQKKIYVVKDDLPLGHGEKSLSVLQDFIKLTEEEKLAIRWHMGPYEPGVNFLYPTGCSFRGAINKYPLVTLLFTADNEAGNVLEKIKI